MKQTLWRRLACWLKGDCDTAEPIRVNRVVEASRSSVARFEASSKTLREIIEELHRTY